MGGLGSRAPHKVANAGFQVCVACESGLRFPCRGLGLLPKGGSSPAPKALKWRSMGTKQSERPRPRAALVESRQERRVLTLSLGVSRAIIPFWPWGKSG